MENNTLVWLQEWYQSNCDGEWEHDNTINIETLDNPGWYIKIDLKDTALEDVKVKRTVIDNDENDWYDYEIKDAVYKAAGDPNKLEFLLLKFKEIVKSAESAS